MKQYKQWYQSKSIIGGLSAMVLVIIKTAGFDLDEGMVTELIINIGSLIAISMSIYGRIMAEKRISQ